MNIDEIKAKMDEIAASNEHWKSCQDGSYEMAMDRSGYYELAKQYKALKESSNG
jgi:hypothetical protein